MDNPKPEPSPQQRLDSYPIQGLRNEEQNRRRNSGPGFTRRLSNDLDPIVEGVPVRTPSRRRSSENSQIDNLFELKYQYRHKATFTIGDSSSETSGSMTPADSRHDVRRTSEEPDGDGQDPSRGEGKALGLDAFRKFHLQSDQETGFVNMDYKQKALMVVREMSDDGNYSVRSVVRPLEDDEEDEHLHVSTASSTGPMLPAGGRASIARLDDFLSERDYHDQNNTYLGICARGWERWRILIACSIVQLFSALMVSLQAPFYPAEAEKKGSTALEYGFVFGVFELTVFIIMPFYGSQMHKWNPRVVFHIGIFVAGISSIGFGLLDKIPSGKYFIVASGLVRAVEALGESAVVTASRTIVAQAFPDAVGPTAAIVESFYSIGLISGPFVGSILYQLGGYSIPFITVGGSLLAAAFLSFVILPSAASISEFHQRQPVVMSSYRSFRLLAVPGIAISALCIILGAMSISYLQATLEPHLRQFGISQLTTGAILIINLAAFTIFAPIWGLACDKTVQLKCISFIGIATLGVGFSLIGPVPVFHFEQKLWILAVGLTLQGIGLGAVMTASSMSIMRQEKRNGLPDSPSNYATSSSLWSSMYSLGSFFGAVTSGVLYDFVGFPTGTYSVIGYGGMMMSILIIYMLVSDTELESVAEREAEAAPLVAAGTSSSLYSTHLPRSRENRHNPRTYGSTSV